MSRLVQKLTREPDDVNMILPFNEVIEAVGMEGERNLGLQTIELETVVGTVDSRRDFDRRSGRPRPGCGSGGSGWRSPSAAACRCRRSMSTGSGTLHFVRDGHHRVSIAIATGQTMIDAYVTEVRTTLSAKGISRRGRTC